MSFQPTKTREPRALSDRPTEAVVVARSANDSRNTKEIRSRLFQMILENEQSRRATTVSHTI